jgi:eukaryotic-like serine/threonine-protein kinase
MNESFTHQLNRQADLAGLYDAMLSNFEAAWQRTSGDPPDIGALLESCSNQPDDWRRYLLMELILVDQEYRWKANQRGRQLPDRLGSQATWNDYRSAHPELGEIAELPTATVAEEYCVRTLWGDKPTHDAFLTCYPFHIASLVVCLQAIDRELAADREAREPELAPHAIGHTVPPCVFTFDDFLLQKHLGTGGLGKVYRAWQHSAQRTVAVKTIRKQHRRNPTAVENLVRELNLMGELKHPAIVRVHGLGGYPAGGYFLVEDYIAGPNLQTVIERGPLPMQEAVRITLAVAEAVEFAHVHGVLHCDLKPANVLQGANGQTFVADFSFGQWIQSKAGASPQWLGGTWGFAAPEMLLPELEELSVASDVFGLGALCFALLTGAAPRKSLDPSVPLATMREALLCTPRRPTELRVDIPTTLEAIVLKCLAINPAERYPSARQLAESLATVNLSAPVSD